MRQIKTIEDIKYDDFFNHQQTLTEYEKAKTQDIIDAFKEIYQADETKYRLTEIMAYIRNIITIINSSQTDLVTIMIWQGKEYGFIPNFQNITTGELIDLDECLKNKNWKGIASILYRPIINKNKKNEYEVEEYKGYDESLFAEASIRFYIGFINFFYKSFQILSRNFPSFTIQEKTKTKKKM